MRRIRRVSIEVIRRELHLAIARPVAAKTEASPARSADERFEVEVGPPRPTECPACASPWFVLPSNSDERPGTVQRALEKHGIHTQLSPAGELFVCGRSFELHIRSSGVRAG